MAQRVELHYGGRVYKLAEGEGGVLFGVDVSRHALVEVPLDMGERLTILLGPGIPAAVVVTDVDENASQMSVY